MKIARKPIPRRLGGDHLAHQQALAQVQPRTIPPRLEAEWEPKLQKLWSAARGDVTFLPFRERIIGMRDTELLARYLDRGLESAFTELVNRYVNLAYSVAQRQLRARDLAEEVVQMTFCLLARKAPTLTHYDSLAGWIYRTTYNLSLKALRHERTRRQREAMAELHDPKLAGASVQPWEHLLPLLDEAFSQLPDSDRTVLVLRFTQGKAMRELGEALGTTEAAAKMRVSRAILKVREFFQKRGVVCSSAQLVAAMAALGTDAAPAGLTASAVAAALAGSAGTVVVGSLAKTAILMAKLKTKLVLLGLGAAAVVMTGSYLLDHSLSLLPGSSGDDGPGVSGPSAPAQPRRAHAPAAFREKWASRIRDLGLARATAKLKAALNAPPRKGTRSYPSKAMNEAIIAFGPYQQHAFAILQEAIQGDDLEAKLQAISVLGRVGKNVPEARPLVWTLLKAGEDRVSSMALGALGNMGILPEEIGSLAAMIPGQTDQQLVRYLPEQIARAIQRDPAAVKPYLGAVEALLQDPDPAVRFSAACALAEHRGGEDPQILRGLAAGLAVSDRYRLRNEATGEVVRHLMAVETLQRLGSAARPVLPDLQEFAGLTPDSVIRELALRTIAAINPDVGRTDPEIHSIVTRDEQRNSLLDRLHAGTCSIEELSQALKEPMAASLAAARLGEFGSAAKERLPELHQALAGKDEATRDEILSAMKQIDPGYVVARVPRDPVAHGTLAADLELEMQRSQGELNDVSAARLEKLIDRFRMGNTSWYTKREVTAFVQQLQKDNPRMWTAFLTKASQVDPDFSRSISEADAPGRGGLRKALPLPAGLEVSL